MTDILIIGGGIAGLTAALYALRAGKSVTVIEKETFGGQITSSPRVDNYPGLPGVSGNELADALLSQVMDLGGGIEMEQIAALRRTESGFAVDTGKKIFEGKAVILATGARHRPLGLPREEELTGRGVSYCALCDGAFHQGEDVAVVGGGNSAAQAAAFLADVCKTVTVIQEFDHFTCDQRDYAAMAAKKNVREMLSAKATALQGGDRLTGIEITDQETGEKRSLPVTGLFITIGRIPDTEPFRDLIACDEHGFFLADDACATNIPGVWAAGDVNKVTFAEAGGSATIEVTQFDAQGPDILAFAWPGGLVAGKRYGVTVSRTDPNGVTRTSAPKTVTVHGDTPPPGPVPKITDARSDGMEADHVVADGESVTYVSGENLNPGDEGAEVVLEDGDDNRVGHGTGWWSEASNSLEVTLEHDADPATGMGTIKVILATGTAEHEVFFA